MAGWMDAMAESISASLEGLSVGPQEVVVDGLNFLSFFTPANEPDQAQASPWQLFAITRTRVSAFLKGCKLAKLKPTFVIDAGWQSEEAMDKWKARREKEVLDEKRSMPCDADSTLAAILREEKAEVLQPNGVDADDVVANLAFDRGAFILSGDRDMLRYEKLNTRTTHKIFVTFAFKPDGSVVLIPRQDFDLRDIERRKLDKVMLSDLATWKLPRNQLRNLANGNKYIRGNSDSFTKRAGNLHLVSRPLRQAVYARLGYKSVDELFPSSVSEGEVVWCKDSVKPDKALDALLDDPKRAMEWLITADAVARVELTSASEKEQRSHARAMLVARYTQCCPLKKPTPASPTDMLADSRVLDVAKKIDPFYKAHEKAWRVPIHMVYTQCNCGKSSNVVSGEAEFFWSKGYSLPKSCQSCRKAKKAYGQARA